MSDFGKKDKSKKIDGQKITAKEQIITQAIKLHQKGNILEGDDLLLGTRTRNVLPGYDPCGTWTSNGIPAT